MKREDILEIVREAYERGQSDLMESCKEASVKAIELAVLAEREACEALHQHEDVLAPIGNSAWGEAYQEGWAAGTAAYRDAIRARGNT